MVVAERRITSSHTYAPVTSRVLNSPRRDPPIQVQISPGFLSCASFCALNLFANPNTAYLDRFYYTCSPVTMKSGSTASGSGATRSELPAQASSSTSRSTSPKAHPPTPTSTESLKDAETYQHLLALGLPAAITLDDFTRLLNHATCAPSTSGKAVQPARASADRKSGSEFRGALEFLGAHLVGRDEARRLRGCIARYVPASSV